jgi:hypothetical protein
MTIDLDQPAARPTLLGRRTKLLFLAYSIAGLSLAIMI